LQNLALSKVWHKKRI